MYATAPRTGALRSSLSKFLNITASFVLVASTTMFGLAFNAVNVEAAATVETVSGTTVSLPDVKNKWWFNRDASTSTPFEFNLDQATIGDGALYVPPIGTNPADKFIGEYFVLEDLNDVNSISYDFLIGPGGNSTDANEFYLNAYVNYQNSGNFGDCVYNVVPGDTTGWTTATFDPSSSYDVRDRGTGDRTGGPASCPSTPSDLPSTAHLNFIALNLGDTGNVAGIGTDAGVDGYFDNVVVSIGSNVMVYDFEPSRLEAPTLLSPEDMSVQNGTILTNDWSDVTGADMYRYESYRDSALTDLRFTDDYPASEKTATNVANTTFWWRVAAVDTNGIPGYFSPAFKVTVDNDDPEVEITSHSDGDVVSGAVDIRGSYSDENPDWRRVAIRDLSDNSIPFNTGLVDVTGDFTDQLLETWDTTTYEDGDYRINLTGADLADNRGADTVEVSIDNPPAMPTGVTIRQGHSTSAPIIGCSALTNDGLITIDWDDNTEADIDYYWFGIDNANVTRPKHAQVTDSYYFGNVTPGNGPYNYTVIAVDTAGNESPMASCGEFNLDIENPVAELTNLTGGEYVSGDVAVNGTVTDDNPWRYYAVVRNGGTTTKVAGPGTVYESNSFTDQLLFNWDTTALVDGEYDVHLAARDLATNRGVESEDSVTVNVDNTGPVTTVTTPETATAYNGTITVEGTSVDAGVGTDTVNVVVKDDTDTEVFNTDATYNSADDTWTLDVDTELSALGDGDYTFVFTATDLLGNSSEETVLAVSIDNTAPGSSFTALSVTDDPSPELNGTTDDPTATIEVTVDGQTVAATNNGDGTWTVAAGTLTPLADGTYDVEVKSTDDLGNEDNITFLSALTSSTTPEPETPDTVVSPSVPSNPGGVGGDDAVLGVATTTVADDSGEVAGENTDDENGDVLQATDEASEGDENSTEEESDSDCARILGVCWYFWIIPIVLGIVGYNYYASRKEQ